MKLSNIIDSHVHITPPEIKNNMKKYRKKESYFDLLSGSEVNRNVTGEELIKVMDENRVQKSIVFGFAFKSFDLCKRVNDYTIHMIEKYPERLIGFAVVNPRHQQVEKELKRCLDAGLQGVGELFPTGQQFDMTSKDALDVTCKFCRKHNWPILIHLNEPVGHYYKGKTDDSIKKGEILADNFPRINFIYAHLGGGLCFYELMPELKKKLKNVYYDTAALPFLYSQEIYDSLKAAGLLDKILFGTDYPLIPPGDYLQEIDNTLLTRGDKQKILTENISKLLKV